MLTIYQAVGEALTMWEQLEEDIAKMFMVLVGGRWKSDDPTRRAFGSVESGAVRRKMILAAAEAYFGRHWEDKNIRIAFSRVLDAVSWASRRRDDIAHGMAQGFVIDGKMVGYFLRPPHYNTERTKALATPEEGDLLFFMFTDFRYTSKDISGISEKFRELNKVVRTQTGLIKRHDDGTIEFLKVVKP